MVMPPAIKHHLLRLIQPFYSITSSSLQALHRRCHSLSRIRFFTLNTFHLILTGIMSYLVISIRHPIYHSHVLLDCQNQLPAFRILFNFY